MKLDRNDISELARSTGFRQEMLEKVVLLMELLDAFALHPFLKDRLVLKGGTALNLFCLGLPRLSVDIDLNYVGAVERETLLTEKPEIESSVTAICQQKGFSIQRIPTEHAGGKMVLRYPSVFGNQGSLEVDLNFLLRTPFWQVSTQPSEKLGTLQTHFPILDIHELTAGKLSALFSRRASRDLFDVHHLLTRVKFEGYRLRTAFVAYGAMSRKDWRTISPKDIQFDFAELKNKLLPVMQKQQANDILTRTKANLLIQECQETAEQILLPFTKAEQAFLGALYDHAEIRAEFLTDDTMLAKKINNHPALLWKAFNIKRNKKS